MKHLIYILAAASVLFLSCEKKPQATNADSNKEITLKNSNTDSEGKENVLPESVQFEAVPGSSAIEPGSLDVLNVTEFLDFGCGYCFKMNNELPEVEAEFGEKLNVVTYVMPWRGPNVQAFYYLADSKGVGSQVKDMLFKFFHESEIKNLDNLDVLLVVAKEFNIAGSKEELETMLQDSAVQSKISETAQMIAKFKVNSTPTIFVQEAVKVPWPKDILVPTLKYFLKSE